MAVDVLIPPLGQTVDTMTLVNWYKKEGEEVIKGEPLFVIETDKANLDIEAPASGTLCLISARDGDEVKVLSKVALIRLAGEKLPESSLPPTDIPVASQESANSIIVNNASLLDRPKRILISPRARILAEKEELSLDDLGVFSDGKPIDERLVRSYMRQPQKIHQDISVPAISPLARKIAESTGLDWKKMTGTGTASRIMREDVERVLKNKQSLAENASIPSSLTVGDTILLHGAREVIATRMVQSHTQTAPVTLSSEVDATAFVDLRAQFIKEGIHVSYNDLLLYLLGRVLRQYPQLNASLIGQEIKIWQEINIGLAVDTDRGLLVPVLCNVDQKGLTQIALETRQLSERCRNGMCTPEEMKAGTFTLTNLGMYNVDVFSPIINLPQTAILGVGRIKKMPYAFEDTIALRYILWLSLTFDHRLVDGAPAARFLQRVMQMIERPYLLMV